MKQKTRILRVLAAVLLTVGLSSCDSPNMSRPSDIEAQFSPGSPQRVGAARRIARVNQTGGTAGAMANNGVGARIVVAEHSLTVPWGAVRQSTWFEMTLDAGEFFGVELTATKVGSRSLNDVGARGFVRPVVLCFDLADARIDGIDPATLSIAEMVNGGFLKVRTWVAGDELCGELRHFSGYTMIED